MINSDYKEKYEQIIRINKQLKQKNTELKEEIQQRCKNYLQQRKNNRNNKISNNHLTLSRVISQIIGQSNENKSQQIESNPIKNQKQWKQMSILQYQSIIIAIKQRLQKLQKQKNKYASQLKEAQKFKEDKQKNQKIIILQMNNLKKDVQKMKQQCKDYQQIKQTLRSVQNESNTYNFVKIIQNLIKIEKDQKQKKQIIIKQLRDNYQTKNRQQKLFKLSKTKQTNLICKKLSWEEKENVSVKRGSKSEQKQHAQTEIEQSSLFVNRQLFPNQIQSQAFHPYQERLQPPYFVQQDQQLKNKNQYTKRSFVRKKIVKRTFSIKKMNISKSKVELNQAVNDKIKEIEKKYQPKESKMVVQNEKSLIKTVQSNLKMQISQMSQEDSKTKTYQPQQEQSLFYIEVQTKTPKTIIYTNKICLK